MKFSFSTVILSATFIGQSCWAAAAPLTYSSSPNQYFDNNNPITDSIVIDDEVQICDVDLFVDIQHTWTDDIDLVLRLTNPLTITMTTLVSDRCGSSDDLIVTFDDDSTNELWHRH